jgi:hypothetical protein
LLVFDNEYLMLCHDPTPRLQAMHFTIVSRRLIVR